MHLNTFPESSLKPCKLYSLERRELKTDIGSKKFLGGFPRSDQVKKPKLVTIGEKMRHFALNWALLRFTELKRGGGGGGGNNIAFPPTSPPCNVVPLFELSI